MVIIIIGTLPLLYLVLSSVLWKSYKKKVKGKVLAQVEDQKLDLLPDILHKSKAWEEIKQTGGGKENEEKKSLVRKN